MTYIKKYKGLLKFIFALALFIFVIFQLKNELTQIDLNKTRTLFKTIPTLDLTMLMILGIYAVFILTLYDVILIKQLKINMPVIKVLKISYIINALNAVIGFGGLIGAGLRHVVYREHYENEKTLIKGISLLLLSMISGMSLLAIGMVIGIFPNTHAFDQLNWYKWALIIICLFLPFFIIFSIVKPVGNDKLLGIKFTLISSLEWLVASGLFYLIFKTMGIHIEYGLLISIFVISALAGLISLVPGGFGAFDLMFLLGLKTHGIAEEKVLLALVLYRIVYYFIPFLLSLVLSTFVFNDYKDQLEDNKYVAPALETHSLFLSVLKDVLIRIPQIALGLLVLITGIFFLMGNINIIYDAIYDVDHTTYLVLTALHSAASLILIVCSIGVMYDTMRAHIMSMISTVILLVTTYLTFGSIFFYAWLVILLILLYLGNRNVKHIKRAITPKRALFSLGIGLIAIFFNASINRFEMDTVITQDNIDFDSQMLRHLFFVMLLSFALLSVLITMIFRKKFKNTLHMPLTEEERMHILNTYGGNYVSHLAFTNDKLFFTNDAKDAFMMFQYHSDSIVVLGDPLGNPESIDVLLQNFYDQTEYFGYDVIFYQVQPTYLPKYHDYGNIFFKLGEEAVIPLSDFTIAGKKKRAFRATVNKFENEGYRYEVVSPPFSETFLTELKSISDEWLDGRNEMNFSVGKFDADYLNKADIGVIRNDEEIIGFVTMMPTYMDDTISVDLIRWKETGLQMMDGLYLMTMLHLKEHYSYFNMGMAPLSNVGRHQHAFYREKFAGKIFDSISHLYSFKGLRNYKEKFNPNFEPRYLVYKRHSSLISSILKASMIINKNKN